LSSASPAEYNRITGWCRLRSLRERRLRKH
jgi:hypothetical protein